MVDIIKRPKSPLYETKSDNSRVEKKADPLDIINRQRSQKLSSNSDNSHLSKNKSKDRSLDELMQMNDKVMDRSAAKSKKGDTSADNMNDISGHGPLLNRSLDRSARNLEATRMANETVTGHGLQRMTEQSLLQDPFAGSPTMKIRDSVDT